MFKYYALLCSTMTYEVKVTRKGQTTIPAEIRKRRGIKEGSRLKVIDTKRGIIFKPALSTADLAGSGSKHATVKEMKKKLDELRNEDL